MMSKAKEIALQLFQGAAYPQGYSSQWAWLGIHQVLMWYEPVMAGGIVGLPHIIDADKLRPPVSRVASSQKVSPWQQRAIAVEKYLSQKLGCPPSEVESHLDQLMQHPSYQGVQRQNPLGAAFVALVAHSLQVWGNSALQYQQEIPARSLFPGIVVQGRSANPKIDIAVQRQGQLKAILSCKWSLRHDRLNDMLNECPAYKHAAYVQTRAQIDYIVVTNEFDPARLHKVLDDQCVDALVHVHKPAVTEVCGLNARLSQMLDLTDLIARTHSW